MPQYGDYAVFIYRRLSYVLISPKIVTDYQSDLHDPNYSVIEASRELIYKWYENEQESFIEKDLEPPIWSTSTYVL